jgi:hypothetical protein
MQAIDGVLRHAQPAIERMHKAQQANHYRMGGHAGRAIELSQGARYETQAAAPVIDRPIGRPGRWPRFFGLRPRRLTNPLRFRHGDRSGQNPFACVAMTICIIRRISRRVRDANEPTHGIVSPTPGRRAATIGRLQPASR